MVPALDVQVYELAPKPVKVTELPAQVAVLDATAVTLRLVTTAMEVVAVPTHPFALEPDTVYVVVTVGLPVTVAPLVLLKPGLHV
jgi:hypothetical protein